MGNTVKKPNFLLRAIVIFIIAAFVVTVVILTYATNNLRKELDDASEKLYEEKLKLSELEEKFNSEIDDEYIEKVAREHGYNKQDEVIFYNNLPES